MEALTIKTPADVLSFIGHTLGFWPKESLVCITLDKNNIVGATPRVDLPNPREPDSTQPHPRLPRSDPARDHRPRSPGNPRDGDRRLLYRPTRPGLAYPDASA